MPYARFLGRRARYFSRWRLGARELRDRWVTDFPHIRDGTRKADCLHKPPETDLPAPLRASQQAKSVSKVIKADIYPEFGTYPGGGESPIIPFDDDKNAEREIIHGRWAMLGVTGAWAAENGTGIPWFTAGTLCTPDDCTAVADKFPGAVAPLAPEGSGYPSFWAVLAIEVVLVGLAEAYRTGLADPAFDELTVGDVSPGGRFDPLGLAESGDLEELKIKELKHCRLCLLYTSPSPRDS